MALTIASREVDGVTVLDLSGRITLGEGSVQLREAIRDLISKGSKSILLNLGDVNYIDSSGLGELVSAYTTAKNQGANSEAAQADQEGQGRAAAHQALHRFRHLRRRSQRHRLLQVVDAIISGEPQDHRTLKRLSKHLKGHPHGWPFALIGNFEKPSFPFADRLPHGSESTNALEIAAEKTTGYKVPAASFPSPTTGY